MAPFKFLLASVIAVSSLLVFDVSGADARPWRSYGGRYDYYGYRWGGYPRYYSGYRNYAYYGPRGYYYRPWNSYYGGYYPRSYYDYGYSYYGPRTYAYSVPSQTYTTNSSAYRERRSVVSIDLDDNTFEP